ncbi:cholinesterase 2-like [Anoplophora glabripennis]|uniref:cholinesterase 2-like n=1 Tax=Anoplophora glabripennis TaxID=217634 RepID=UPI000C77BB2F|nr:cholinesterase 2-like [Anoplophora glabripennis]
MMKYNGLLLLILCAISSSVADVADPTLVTLPEGQIRGQALQSPNDNVYYAFQDIPYATPPVGELRFQKPGDTSQTPLAVLIWIHGGGFVGGSGAIQEYKPGFFIDHNIVVVTLNYRVGVLGFLTTEDGVIPGNLGLKDQHLALQWVRNNIDLFGGDPEKITIAGESAGAGSVGYQIISQQNKGLFRGGILQSLTPLHQQAHQNYARFYAFELVAVGKESGLLEGQGLIWMPVIEDASLDGALLTGLFHEDIRTGNINQVPIIIGFNSEEALGAFKTDPSNIEVLPKYFDSDLSNLIRNKFNMTKENKLTAGTRLRQIYTDGTFEDDPGQVVKFYSDESFTTPVIRHAKLQSNYTDVYMYQFSYKGNMGDMKDVEIAGVRGVCHGEDLGYLWDSHLSNGSNGSSGDDPEDVITRQRLLTLWSNFVKYLNPTPEVDSFLGNVTWEKVSPNNLVYLNINDTLEMQTNPRDYLKWERIIDVYAIPPLVNY